MRRWRFGDPFSKDRWIECVLEREIRKIYIKENNDNVVNGLIYRRLIKWKPLIYAFLIYTNKNAEVIFIILDFLLQKTNQQQERLWLVLDRENKTIPMSRGTGSLRVRRPLWFYTVLVYSFCITKYYSPHINNDSEDFCSNEWKVFLNNTIIVQLLFLTKYISIISRSD